MKRVLPIKGIAYQEFKDIRYYAYNDKENDQDKDKEKEKSAEKTQKSTYAIFLKSRWYKDIKYDILTAQQN